MIEMQKEKSHTKKLATALGSVLMGLLANYSTLAPGMVPEYIFQI